EGGFRVPAAVRWPGRIPAGIECGRIASSIDVLPTLAEISGSTLPEKKIDGVSILSLMEGKTEANPRNNFYYYYGGNLIAVRKNNWKLVFPHTYRSYKGMEPGKDGFPGPYGKGNVTELELYDLNNDIGETTNLVAQYPDIVEDLKILGDSAREELGDRIQNKRGKAVRKPGRRLQEKTQIRHLAINKGISVKSEYSYQYAGHGDITLINGTLGSFDFTDEEWLGFEGIDFEAVVDMGELTRINQVECGFLLNQGSWIFIPQKVVISISEDGNDYELIKTFKNNARKLNDNIKVRKFKTEINNSSARFIKIHATNMGTCPDWHAGAGGKAWLFIDEIIIK
ncbi:MAG: hypothetical protein KAJ50_08600, partial [Bacteroidales bacterium]|nr:hypothetical protein [Bacteroidales bacterium]